MTLQQKQQEPQLLCMHLCVSEWMACMYVYVTRGCVCVFVPLSLSLARSLARSRSLGSTFA
jgi:hypothetical protein